MDATGKKTIFFHPDLMPDIAVLDAELTVGLPPHITAATGMDAFSHCLEAYLVDNYHPMADAIALEGLEIILTNLPKCMADGTDLEARGNMLLAASMGATAFQKGLGMVHSLAHALSEVHNTHHGMANALMLTECIKFTYDTALQQDMFALMDKLKKVNEIISCYTLSDIDLPHYNTMFFMKSIDLDLSLEAQGIIDDNIKRISDLAFRDPCHLTHPFAVTKEDFKTTLIHTFERNNNGPE
jgi:alcohol dehydrogenase class IV